MQDNLIICNKCGGNACYEYEMDGAKFYNCFGCGFCTNDYWSKSNESFSDLEHTVPELYRDLKFTDNNGYYWFPQTINNPKKGMIFADGTDKNTWKWTAVLSKPIEKKERHKFPPGQTYKMDMTTKKEYDQGDFMEALDYINYFDKTFI
jgi:hypothetical protein